MRKILTIDCWNTLVKPSGDKEAVIYLLSQRLRVPYDLLYHTVENLKERIKPEHHNVSNYMFWHYIKVELGLTIPVYRILAHAEEAYQMYSPQMINPDGWRDMVSTAQKNNFEVKILSNTGYLKSEWMNDWITHNFRFFDKVPFIGSDLIGIAKPNKEFYLTALDGVFNPSEDRWLHIGDSVVLDIDPVKSLGGTAVEFEHWGTLDNKALKEFFL